jgi:uncharacterized cysteine cluster protein YcgN (CxxCxxCC family)
MIVKGLRVVTDEPCEFLDATTGLCTMFDDRRSREEKTGLPCLTIEEMLENNTVPVECLHVKDKKKYRKKRDRRHYHFKILLED